MEADMTIFGTDGTITEKQAQYIRDMLSGEQNYEIISLLIKNALAVRPGEAVYAGDRKFIGAVDVLKNWAVNVDISAMSKDGASQFIDTVKNQSLFMAFALACGIKRTDSPIYFDEAYANKVAEFVTSVTGTKVFVGSKTREDGIKRMILCTADGIELESRYSFSE